MPVTVFYHGQCMDGFCAAWVAHKVLGSDNVQYVPVAYGQKQQAELIQNRTVYILDFSWRKDVLKFIVDAAHSVVLIDHHATTIEEYANGVGESLDNKLELVLDEHNSGARLTWDYFFCHAIKRPRLVDYTEDRDLWRWLLPDSRAFSAALATYPMTFSMWDELERSLRVEDGYAILRYQEQLVSRAVNEAREIEFEGYNVFCVNASCLASEIGERLAIDRPFAMTFYISGGKKVVSLRSAKDGIDVSAIARKHGGGGHKHAAGFALEL